MTTLQTLEQLADDIAEYLYLRDAVADDDAAEIMASEAQASRRPFPLIPSWRREGSRLVGRIGQRIVEEYEPELIPPTLRDQLADISADALVASYRGPRNSAASVCDTAI